MRNVDLDRANTGWHFHSALCTLNSALRLAARVGLAPTPCGLTNRRATLTPPGNLQLALPAGFAPASVRLEDECLVDFGHGSRRNGLMECWIDGLVGDTDPAPNAVSNHPVPKMVSAAGFAPAISRSQAECPAAAGLRADCPGAFTTPPDRRNAGHQP